MSLRLLILVTSLYLTSATLPDSESETKHETDSHDTLAKPIAERGSPESTEDRESTTSESQEETDGFKSSGSASRSHALNSAQNEAQVDARTGSLSFGITVGHIVANSRQFDLTLKFDMQYAESGYDPFGLGKGWFLNIPWINRQSAGAAGGRETFLYMGDGASYKLEPTSSALPTTLKTRYSEGKHIKIWTNDGVVYEITQRGDNYTIGYNGRLKSFTSKEGFRYFLTTIENRGFLVENETDVVFNCTYVNDQYMTELSTRLPSGNLVWQVFRDSRSEAVMKIECEDCGYHEDNSVNNYEFEYFKMLSTGTYPTKITYPSGLTHELTYSPLGGTWKTAVITKIVSNPGSNSFVKYPGSYSENETTTFDFDPKGTRTNYRGTNLGIGGKGVDVLMELDRKYEYFTRTLMHSTCILHAYNKFHLEIETVTHDCFSNKVYTRVLKSYPCSDEVPFKNLINECELIGNYNFPTNITTIIYGYNNSQHVSAMLRSYDDWGHLLKTTEPNGIQTNFTYYPDNEEAQVGQFRPLLKRVVQNVGTRDIQNEDPYKKYENIYNYNRTLCYTSESMDNCSFLLLHSVVGVVKVKHWIAEKVVSTTSYEYYLPKASSSDADMRLFYAKPRSERFSTVGTQITLLTTYNYSQENGLLETQSRTVSLGENEEDSTQIPVFTSSVADIQTGTLWNVTNKQGITTTNSYDVLERKYIERVYSIDMSEYQETRWHHVVGNNINSVKSVYPDNKSDVQYFDNKGKMLEISIQYYDDWLPTKSFQYRYFRNNDSAGTEITETKINRKNESYVGLSTVRRTDFSGRLTEVMQPNGIIKFYSYDAGLDGVQTYSTLRANTSNGFLHKNEECTVVDSVGNTIRQGQLKPTVNVLEPWRYACEAQDCHWIKFSFFDEYSRLLHDIRWYGTYQVAVLTYTYDYEGRVTQRYKVGSKPTTGEVPTFELLKFEYNQLHNLKDLSSSFTLQIGTEDVEIGRRGFNLHGQQAWQTAEGVTSETNYNNYGNIALTKTDDATTTYEYDKFQRPKMQRSYLLENESLVLSISESHTYDILGRLTNTDTTTNSGVRHTKHFDYDDMHGELSKMHITIGNETFTFQQKYDLMGRVYYIKDFLGIGMWLNYDQTSGLLTDIEYKNKLGHRVAEERIEYDVWGKANKRTLLDVQSSTKYVHNIAYDDYDKPLSYVYTMERHESGNPVLIGNLSIEYNAVDEIASKVRGSTEERFYYGRDEKRISVYECREDDSNSNPTITWRCPEVPHLPGIRIAKQEYVYDQLGNVIKVKTYDQMWQPPTVLSAVIVEEFEYHGLISMPATLHKISTTSTDFYLQEHVIHDKRGNMISTIAELECFDSGKKSTWTADTRTYDALNHPIRIEQELASCLNIHNRSKTAIEQTFDSSGELVFYKDQNGVEHKLLHSPGGRLWTELSEDGRNFSYLYDDRLIKLGESFNGALDKIYLVDPTGTVLACVDDQENLQYADYTPFGSRPHQKGLSANCSRVGFQNMWLGDDDTYTTGNGRSYNPQIYRFMQYDSLSPFGDGGSNGYIFAEDSPVQRGDPTGFVGVMQMLGMTNNVVDTGEGADFEFSRSGGYFTLVRRKAYQGASLETLDKLAGHEQRIRDMHLTTLSDVRFKQMIKYDSDAQFCSPYCAQGVSDATTDVFDRDIGSMELSPDMIKHVKRSKNGGTTYLESVDMFKKDFGFISNVGLETPQPDVFQNKPFRPNFGLAFEKEVRPTVENFVKQPILDDYLPSPSKGRGVIGWSEMQLDVARGPLFRRPFRRRLESHSYSFAFGEC